MITIEPKHREILLSITSQYPYSFYVFGSRATGRAKKFSDLDLFYKEHIPDGIISQLEELFEESDLPYKIDLIDYNKCDVEFQKILNSAAVVLK